MSDRTALLGSAFGEEEREISVWSTLWTALSRIRRDPGLVVPFFFAGVVVTIVDYLRLRDPVPVRLGDDIREGSINVAYAIYPTGTRGSTTPLGAFVDLEPLYLFSTVVYELTAFFAVCVAGWLTLSWAMGERSTPSRLVGYLTFVALVQLGFRALGFVGVVAFGLFGLVLLVVALAFLVRLFFAPLFVVAGDDVRTAVRRSARFARGHGWTLFGLVVVLGLSAFALRSVPLVGPALSAAVVAPVHAVAMVVIAERTGVQFDSHT